MPEGPEVKRCSEVVKDTIEGKVLSRIELVSGKMARLGVKDLDLIKLPVRVERVTTKGKLILIQLEGDHQIISTLGMSGWWYPDLDTIDKSLMDEAYYSKVITTIEKAQKHTRITLHTEDGKRAHYVDPRNFGNFYILDDEHFCKKIDEIGIDLLHHPVSDNRIFSWVRGNFYKKSNRAVAEILLDQSVMAGLGNIYRAETLYLSKIDPHRKGKDISEEELGKIIRNAQMVLNIAYDGRGTMIYPVDAIKESVGDKFIVPDWINIDQVSHIRGHVVYGLQKDLFGNKVEVEEIGGRTCWWVPTVQS